MKIELIVTSTESRTISNRSKTLVIKRTGFKTSDYLSNAYKCWEKNTFIELQDGKSYATLEITGEPYTKKLGKVTKTEIKKAGFYLLSKKDWLDMNHRGCDRNGEVICIPCKCLPKGAQKHESMYLDPLTDCDYWQIEALDLLEINKNLKRMNSLCKHCYIERLEVRNEDYVNLEWDIRDAKNHRLCAQLYLDDSTLCLEDDIFYPEKIKNSNFLNEIYSILTS